MASVCITTASNAVLVFGEKTEDYEDVILRVCIERNQRYSHKLVEEYIQWEKANEFASNVHLYKKVYFFFKQRVLEKNIPIFAKTMTGELIPLLYRPYCDKRNLLEQLEEIDSDLYPFGSTNIFRLVEDPSKPVEEGEIFGIIQHEFHVVRYNFILDDTSGVIPKNGPYIYYDFKIKAKCFTHDGNHLDIDHDEVEVSIKHFLDKNTVVTCPSNEYPIDRIHEEIGSIYFNTNNGDRYYINEQAQQELVALFHIVRRDL